MTKQHEWWVRYERQFGYELNPTFREYLRAENVASATDTFQQEFIPGTLQTPGYMAAVFRSFGSPVLPGQLIRIARQVVLHTRGTYLRHVVSASALRRRVGTYDTWREQLESIRLCPSLVILDDVAPDTPSFIVIHGEVNAVSIEHDRGTWMTFNHDPDNYADFADAFIKLLEAALPVTETPSFIDSILEETDEY